MNFSRNFSRPRLPNSVFTVHQPFAGSLKRRRNSDLATRWGVAKTEFGKPYLKDILNKFVQRIQWIPPNIPQGIPQIF